MNVSLLLRKYLKRLYSMKKLSRYGFLSSDVDPDPDPDSFGSVDPDPDPEV